MSKTMDEATALPAKEEILMNEDALIAGLLEAANYKEDYTPVQVKRNGKLLFEFRIRPMGEDEIQECRKRATKMVPNPAGRHLPKVEGDIDIVALRCYKILSATVDEDRKKVWDNPAIKKSLNVLTPVDVIDAVLMAGEKDAVCDLIDNISGYNNNQVTTEEYAKN